MQIRTLAVTFLILMVIATSLPARAGPEARGRDASRADYDWFGPLELTDNTTEHMFSNLAITDDDKVHIVSSDLMGDIYYMRLWPNMSVEMPSIEIGHSFTGPGVRPSIAAAPHGDAIWTYINEVPGDPPTIYYEIGGYDAFFQEYWGLNNTGGDGILVDDDYNMYVFRFTHWTSVDPPDTGPIQVIKYNRSGGVQWVRDAGWHNLSYLKADMCFDPNGDILIVNMYNRYDLNLTRITPDGAVTHYHPNVGDFAYNWGMEDVSMTVDPDGQMHILYTMLDKYEYKFNAHLMRMSPAGGTVSDGTVLMNNTMINRWGAHIVGPDSNGVMMIISSQGAEGGAPETEFGRNHMSMFIDTSGNVVREQEVFNPYRCPDTPGNAALNRTGVFVFVTENAQCTDQPMPLDPVNDIVVYYTDPPPLYLYDVAVTEVSTPITVRYSEPFELYVQFTNEWFNHSSALWMEIWDEDNDTLYHKEWLNTVCGYCNWLGLPEITLFRDTNLTIKANLTDPKGDVNLTNNTVTIFVNVIMPPDIAITELWLDPDVPVVGDTVRINASVENLGETGAIFDVDIDPGIFNAKGPMELDPGEGTNVGWEWMPSTSGNFSFTMSVSNLTVQEAMHTHGNDKWPFNIIVLDNAPPVINITSPVEDEVVTSWFDVTGRFSDPEGDKVYLTIYLDGRPLNLSVDIRGEGYTYRLNADGLGVGPHEMTVQACDEWHCTNATVNVTAELVAQAGIDRTWPADPVTMFEGDTVQFGIETWSNVRMPFTYAWYLDGNRTGPVTPRWDYRAEPTVSVGKHLMRVQAEVGSLSFNVTLNVTVLPNGTAPYIIDWSPKTGRVEADCSGKFEIDVNAADDDAAGLHFDWYIDGVLYHSDTHHGPGNMTSSIDGDIHDLPGGHFHEVYVNVSDGLHNVSMTFELTPAAPGACGGTQPPPDPPVTTESELEWPMLAALVLMVVIIIVALVGWFLVRRNSREERRPPRRRPRGHR